MSAVIRQVGSYVLSAAIAYSAVTVWSEGLELDSCQRRDFISSSHENWLRGTLRRPFTWHSFLATKRPECISLRGAIACIRPAHIVMSWQSVQHLHTALRACVHLAVLSIQQPAVSSQLEVSRSNSVTFRTKLFLIAQVWLVRRFI
jgi:hypothetical protein